MQALSQRAMFVLSFYLFCKEQCCVCLASTCHHVMLSNG